MDAVTVNERSAHQGTPIQFHFQPFGIEKNEFAVEKALGDGPKRRYLVGIASGVKIDGHGERMTDNCIKSFMDQANSGDILLYPDLHGIRASQDIGILHKAAIQPDGDWRVEFRLYDDADGIGTVKKETIEDTWKQSVGAPPYTRPRQKGFSIEGYIPDESIVSMEKSSTGAYGRRVIDNVLLDGVVLVPRPAYKDGIANAVYKALGELPPWQEEKIRGDLRSNLSKSLEARELTDSYFRTRWEVNDALDDEIRKIMTGPAVNKGLQLGILFDEYKPIMIDLIQKSQSVFQAEDGDSSKIVKSADGTSKLEIYKALYANLLRLSKNIKARRNV